MASLEVRFKNKKIGVISLENGSKVCHFEYDKNFINSGIELSPFMMPISNKVSSFKDLDYETFKGLPGLFDGSLPDKFGSLAFDTWLKMKNINKENFNILDWLRFTSNRGMGALEYYPALENVSSLSKKLVLNDLVDFANKVLNDKEHALTKDDEEEIENIINACCFAGGARAKAIVAYNKENDEFKSGHIDVGEGYEYFILKLDGIKNNKDKEDADKSEFTRIEYAYYLMALDSGINMMESRLYKDGKYYHFMTKRFDRYVKDGEMQKIHMQTLCDMMHYDFNTPRIVSYEEVANIIIKLEKSNKNIEQFYRRMVFNVITRNQDDHLKNISFIMDQKGNWLLSPAYDVTFAFNPNGFWTCEHQMIINGKTKDITLYDLICSAKSMGIDALKAKKIITEINNVVSNWSKYAKSAYLSDETINEIESKFVFLLDECL
ncbi:MAG: type II toxin-antitoxin system HipA family toxin [Erysipelotrichales bacterium]|nr:type II toxin-antitoxin system HipA family toxin [Erysipelotrichales bacterium]